MLAAILLATFTAVHGDAQTTAIRFGKLWDGSKTIADAVVP